MKTKVNFTKENLKNAFKLHYNTKYPIRSRMMLFAGLLFWFIGLAFTYFNFPEKYPLFKYLLSLVGLFYIVMYYYRRKKLFERASSQESFNGDFTFDVNKKGITFGKDGKLSKCGWDEITDVIEDENNILFYFGKDKFYILPSESLNDSQMEDLEVLISNKK